MTHFDFIYFIFIFNYFVSKSLGALLEALFARTSIDPLRDDRYGIAAGRVALLLGSFCAARG